MSERVMLRCKVPRWECVSALVEVQGAKVCVLWDAMRCFCLWL